MGDISTGQIEKDEKSRRAYLESLPRHRDLLLLRNELAPAGERKV
jgi:hypothetical protein